MIKYICEVSEWFDKTYANTYFSARLISCKNREVLFAVPLQLGYESHCKDLVLQEMENLKILPPKYRGSDRCLYERENEYPIYWSIRQTTKREALEHGRMPEQ